jgi:hypothetical protein
MGEGLMKESKLETDTKAYAQERGWLVRKMEWVGRRNCPDRFYARKGRVVLIEFKKRGEPLRLGQEREISTLEDFGVQVLVIDNFADAKALLR